MTLLEREKTNSKELEEVIFFVYIIDI